MDKNPNNRFRGPMQPFPGLEGWARQVHLPESHLNIFLYDTGEEAKTPVLLLHGLGDEADTWRHVIPLIRAQHHVIAPDLPGFGRSDKPDVKYAIPFFVDVMSELLDALQIPRTVLMGHSNGAVIAQQMALTHPERVERLILVSGALVAPAQSLNLSILAFLIPGLGERIYSSLRKDPQAAYNTLEPYYHRLSDLPQTDRDFLFQRVNERVWSDGQRRGFLSTFRNLATWLPAQQKDLPARLRNWAIPTEILWGEDDQVNSVENARALARLIPSARFELVPGAGHNLQQEKPQIVAEAINRDDP